MKNNFVSVNKLDNTDKKVFTNRFVIALLIFLYWSFMLTVCLLSDIGINTDWYISLDNKYKGIFAYFFVLLILPFIYGATHELNNLFFGFNMKKTFILLFTGISLFLFLPNFVYITKFYYFPTVFETNTEIQNVFTTIFGLFTLSLTISLIVFILILIYIIKTTGMSDFITLFLFIILSLIIAFGFFSIAFIGLLKSWLVLLFVIFITAFTDVFAYISGMLFGRKKLSKTISPKKTVEGFWIGLILTIGFGLLLTYFISFGESTHNSFENLIHVSSIYQNRITRWIFMVFLIVALSLVSSLGDLAFSYIKRQCQIKDYGNFFQTHGGILDRFDSLLFSSTFYTLLIFFLSGLDEAELFPK